MRPFVDLAVLLSLAPAQQQCSRVGALLHTNCARPRRGEAASGCTVAGSSEEATAAKPPVKPAAAAAGETPPGPPRFSSRIPQLVQQLQSGGPDAKTSAVWALHDLAEGSPHQRIGDAVWEAEGVIPLVTMLSLADSPQAVAAAAAIGQLASADNKAFQVTHACSDQTAFKWSFTSFSRPTGHCDRLVISLQQAGEGFPGEWPISLWKCVPEIRSWDQPNSDSR